MRLLFVVQRYGLEIFGGAEQATRMFASRMAARGHDVEVLTSCALSYVDWADHYEPGTSELEGVHVHRLPVTAPREDRFFGPLNARVGANPHVPPLLLQREWLRAQGPLLDGQTEWLRANAGGFDVAVFFTYLYWTTAAGLPVASSIVPTVLHPLAHDEPAFWLQVFDTTLRSATRMAYLTEEERDLVSRRLGTEVAGRVIGIGSDLDPPLADPAPVRARLGLGDRPYLAYVGRVDPAKGAVELFDSFVAYKQRNPGDLALLYVGEPIRPMPPHPDVFLTGFVDEPTKHALLAGSLALVQPSYFESFSMVLTEAWSLRRPALVQGACAVLRGQALRSGGAIPYEGFAELEAGIDLLVADEARRDVMGAAGRRYVEARYGWDVVLDRYEDVLEATAGNAPRP
ncbi:MAG: glycosyltransferase family 4 protein [Acidimicrobiales bacterium]